VKANLLGFLKAFALGSLGGAIGSIITLYVVGYIIDHMMR
jgi:hypothetical protein